MKTNLTQAAAANSKFRQFMNGMTTMIPVAAAACEVSNGATPGSCGGVMVPVTGSLFQQKYGLAIGVNGSGPFYTSGFGYDELAPGTPPQPYTSAISLTYSTA